MGVNNQGTNPHRMAIVEDSAEIIEDYPVELTNDNQNSEQVKKPRKKRMHYIVHDRSTRSSSKQGGVRQTRRSENMNFLLTMLEGQEDLTEQDFIDITEPSMSVFSELFNAQEKMKIWNDFVNSSEEEQQIVLGMTAKDDVSEDKWEEECMEKDGFTILDKRQVHPSFSPIECFQQIDSGLRSLLKKHLPMGTLCQLEEDVVGFFTEWPSSVYVAKLESSFQRLLLHALCQYLRLSSRSFDDDCGERQTQVENKHPDFQAPEIALTKYLTDRH